jgi:predicted nucleic acid-binding protein
MKPVIVDTSALISLASLDDQNHQKAVSISQNLARGQRVMIVPGEVFTETMNALGRLRGVAPKVRRELQLRVGHELLSSPEFLVIETMPELRKPTLEVLKHQPFSVSFTDCLVMAFASIFASTAAFEILSLSNQYAAATTAAQKSTLLAAGQVLLVT